MLPLFVIKKKKKERKRKEKKKKKTLLGDNLNKESSLTPLLGSGNK